jgi:hypothetical protein
MLTYLFLTLEFQRTVKDMPQLMWNEEEQRKSNAVIGGRQSNSNKYKPGVKAIYLVRRIESIAESWP